MDESNDSSQNFRFINSTGFIDGYKASNFESNVSIIKYHEEELLDLLKLLIENISKQNFGEIDSLIQGSLGKACEKLLRVKNYHDAESAYIQSFAFFQSFLSTIEEIKYKPSPAIQLLLKKILYNYQKLGESTLLEDLKNNSINTEHKFLAQV
jgi:hypothetical protein